MAQVRRGVRVAISLCTLLACGLADASLERASAQTGGVSESAKATQTMYVDVQHGVSFSYPWGWKLEKDFAFYLAPSIVSDQDEARAMLTFSPVGKVYAQTTLSGLGFTYVSVAKPTEASCFEIAGTNEVQSGSKPATVMIHGVNFRHFKAGDAAMCHAVDQQVYPTFRGGRCLLFEEALHTICPGAVDGQRELNEAETRALKQHLHGIMETVRIERAP